ncbi:MAG: SDR family oxidoreductase [Actinomycetes bacterium]|jgi:NAD(P)-dependent dehydrogenase (short-subunit alcohol dehydrogenase family)
MRNRTVLITGASGHIGSNLASHFLEKEWNVVGVANNATLEPKEHLAVISTDFTKIGAGKDLILSAANIFGAIDLVINNAARQDVALLEDEDPKRIHDVIQVNLGAIAEIYAEVASGKYKTESIINLSSIEAIGARPGHSIYGSTKAAIEALTKSAAQEIAPIRSNAIRLGLIYREGINQAWPTGVAAWQGRAPLQRLGTVDDIARAIDYLWESTWTTGTVLTLDGGMSVSANW